MISLHAPMLAAGIGGFLAPTQKSRTFTLEMESYTAEAKPEHEFDDTDVDDLNAVYIFLRHWSARVNLNPKPVMPPGVLRRFADNVRGLLAIADSCGEEWGCAGSTCPMRVGPNTGARAALILLPLRMNEQAELSVGQRGNDSGEQASEGTSVRPLRRRDANSILRHRKRPSSGASVCAWSVGRHIRRYQETPHAGTIGLTVSREQNVILTPPSPH